MKRESGKFELSDDARAVHYRRKEVDYLEGIDNRKYTFRDSLGFFALLGLGFGLYSGLSHLLLLSNYSN